MSAFGWAVRIPLAALVSALAWTAIAGEPPPSRPEIARKCDNSDGNGVAGICVRGEPYKILNKIRRIKENTVKKYAVTVAAAPRIGWGTTGDLRQMLATNTISVSSSQELQQALLDADGGETILLAAGDYGDLNLYSRSTEYKYESGVTIASADEADPATFSTLALNGVQNLSFSGIHVNFKPDEDTVAWDSAVSITKSQGITFSDSTLKGGPAVNGVPPEASELDGTGNVLGLPVGRAFTILDSADIHLENNSISEFDRGVVPSSVDGLYIIDNEISDLRRSPLSGSDLHDVLIENNYFHDSDPWNLGGAGDHADFIHFWSTSDQEIANDNIRILGNTFSQGEGQAIFGIYMAGRIGIGFQNVVVQDNVLYNGDGNGVAFENVNGGSISGNTLLQSSGEETDAPTIILRTGSSDIQVINNISAGIVTNDVDESSLNFSNNLDVQRYDQNLDNYYGDLFVNALAENADLSNLQAIPGGIIEQLGVGAALTSFNSTPDQLTAVIVSSTDAADDSLHYFSGKLTADADGFVSDAGARFLWDFGDGTTGEGITVSHRYADSGDYQVTLRVVGDDGSVDEDSTRAEVHGPYLLKIDFSADGIEEQSGYHSPVEADPALIDTVESPHGFAYHLTDDNDISVAKNTARQIFDLDEFSVSFALKRDSVSDGTGDVARVHGSWRIVMEDDGKLSFYMTNDAGESSRMTTGVAIHDTDWHAVTLDYDAANGTATFYIDGEAVASESVSGGTKPIESWGLTVGSPYGANFNGLIDSFEIYNRPLSAAEVVDLHDQLTQLDGGAGTDSIDNASADGDLTPDLSTIANLEGGTIDTVIGSDSADTISGDSADNDLSGGTDALFGGSGDDASADGGITVDPSTIADIDDSTADTVIGSDSVDTINGDSADNDLSGGNGADVLFGGAGDDRIDSGDGDDLAFGEQGADPLAGGIGADELYGGAGDDRIDGGDGDDEIRGAGGEDDIAGGLGADTIFAGTGADTIDSGDGNDLVFGASGDDYLLGGTGEDSLTAGSDDDEAYGGAGADIVFGGAGQDTLCGGDDDDRVDGGTRSDLVFGAAGDDFVIGGRGHDEVYGGDGNDHVDGGAGDDMVYGAPGDDLITGGAGNDLIFGGLGDDTLIGGAGDDQLDGSQGADRLVFDDAFFGHDTVIGWENGVDLLDFSSAGISFDDFTETTNGAGTLLELTADPGQSIFLAGIDPALVDRADFA